MRLPHVLLTAAILAPAIGCAWLRDQFGMRPRPTGEIQQVTPEQLVGYLNQQAGRMQTLTYGDTRLVARDHGVPMPALRGNLAASQPRNFRLTGQPSGPMGGKLDLGSNEQQFWMYLDAPTMNPLFVFASHKDFEDGRAKLPGNIPFEPDWVMQALGMTTFPPTPQYSVTVQERDRTYTLFWEGVTPNKVPIRKEVVFDTDDAQDPRPQVKRHLIRDAKTNSIICSAEIKSAKTFQVGAIDPQSGRAPVIKYPTNIVLRWEQQKFEMDLTLEAAKVNQQLTEEEIRRLFTRPNIPGASPVDLARYEFPTR